MKYFVFTLFLLFGQSIYAESFHGEMCESCKGLGGSDVWTFWLILAVICAAAAFKLFRKKKNV